MLINYNTWPGPGAASGERARRGEILLSAAAALGRRGEASAQGLQLPCEQPAIGIGTREPLMCDVEISIEAKTVPEGLHARAPKVQEVQEAACRRRRRPCPPLTT